MVFKYLLYRDKRNLRILLNKNLILKRLARFDYKNSVYSATVFNIVVIGLASKQVLAFINNSVSRPRSFSLQLFGCLATTDLDLKQSYGGTIE